MDLEILETESSPGMALKFRSGILYFPSFALIILVVTA